jgi:hypothetical protein
MIPNIETITNKSMRLPPHRVFRKKYINFGEINWKSSNLLMKENIKPGENHQV